MLRNYGQRRSGQRTMNGKVVTLEPFDKPARQDGSQALVVVIAGGPVLSYAFHEAAAAG